METLINVHLPLPSFAAGVTFLGGVVDRRRPISSLIVMRRVNMCERINSRITDKIILSISYSEEFPIFT
jgi:hypothetical protein